MDETKFLAITEANLKMDLEYLTSKRDDALEHFNNKLKSHLLSDEELHKRLDSVLRLNHQVKLMEHTIIVHRITTNNNG